MKFQISEGFTEVNFFENKKGTVEAFPSYNAELVKKKGTNESKELLNKIMNKEF